MSYFTFRTEKTLFCRPNVILVSVLVAEQRLASVLVLQQVPQELLEKMYFTSLQIMLFSINIINKKYKYSATRWF